MNGAERKREELTAAEDPLSLERVPATVRMVQRVERLRSRCRGFSRHL